MKTLLKKDLLLSKNQIIIMIVLLMIFGLGLSITSQIGKGIGASYLLTLVLITSNSSLVDRDLKTRGHIFYDSIGIDRSLYIGSRYVYYLLVYIFLSLVLLTISKFFMASGSLALAEDYRINNALLAQLLAYTLNSNYLFFTLRELISDVDLKLRRRSSLLYSLNIGILIYLIARIRAAGEIDRNLILTMLGFGIVSHIISYKATEIVYKGADI